MSDRYRLGTLDDQRLVASLKGLVRREHDALSDLLAHLAELDERRLYLDLGFSSLFAYCTEALGFCKSSAGRRIAAARVCRRFPRAFEQVALGQLHLSVLSVLGSFLDRENAAELFEVCRGKTQEEVELILAARFQGQACAIRSAECPRATHRNSPKQCRRTRSPSYRRASSARHPRRCTRLGIRSFR